MLRKLYVPFFILVFTMTLAGSAAVMKGGQMISRVGTIGSNTCAEMMGKACPAKAELKREIPVFVPRENGKYDYYRFHYMAVLPRKVQDTLFNKIIKVEGMFYRKTNTIAVHQVWVFEKGEWKTTWTMPKDFMKRG